MRRVRMRDLCKTSSFAQFRRQAQILILEILNVLLWLRFSPSLNLNKIEHFSKVSIQRLVTTLLFLLFAWVVSTAAWAQQAEQARTIEVIGRGEIHKDNVAKARDEAIADGMWNAIEQAVGLLIPPTSVVDHFQVLSDLVYSQAEGFLHDYRVLIESKSGKHYRVVVQATLPMKAVEDKLQDLGILVAHKDKGLPSVLLLLSEQFVGEVSARHSWEDSPSSVAPLVIERTLSSYMRKKGFVLLEPVSVLVPTQDAEPVPEHEAAELTDEAALSLAEQVGAKVVVVGSASAQFSGNVLGTDMKSIEATLSARALRADSGLIIGSYDGTRAAVDADETLAGTQALTLAASDLAKDISRQIVANWGKETSQSILVELVVKGIKEYADFVRFRSILRNEVRGVKNIYLRTIKAGEAKMDVDIKGSPRTLADELMLKSFKGFGINIFEVGQNGIRLELVPKQDVPYELPPEPKEDRGRTWWNHE